MWENIEILIKLVTTAKEETIWCQNQLIILQSLSQEIHYQKKWKKTVYLGLSILELSKILMYEIWYDYEKPKYDEKAKFCHMNIDSFIAYIKIDGIYKGIAEDVEIRFHTSNYEFDRPLPKGKNDQINERWIRWKNLDKFAGLTWR